MLASLSAIQCTALCTTENFLSKLTEARRRISDVGWLSRQPLEFREALLDRCVLRTYAPGESLFGLDDPPGGVYGVAEGFVDAIIASSVGPPFLAFIGSAGWWVGEAAAITRTHHRAELRTRSATQAFHLSLTKFQELTAADPRAFRSFSELTITHMDNAFMLASTLAATDTGSRIVATLYRLAGSFREISDQFELPCKQSEIAEMAGLSRNSAGPVLRRLATEGLIQVGRNQVRYNPVHLRRALNL
jgi:CRP-like cAMP-binding protein